MGARLLVIDDETRMCDSLKALLEPYGHRVDMAFSGNEGVERMREREYDVVITDIRMGEGTGYDVMRHAREHCAYTQVIAITGHASTESAVEALQYTAFDYITKPFEFDALRESIQRALGKVEDLRMRDDLISMLTHDIKVPLTSIMGYASFIWREDRGYHEKAPQYVRTIQESAERILALVDNYLASTKFDAGRLHVTDSPVELNAILPSLFRTIESVAAKERVAFSHDLPERLPPARGEENLIYRMVGNLLNNAIQYADEGGWCKIVVRAIEADASPLHKPSAQIDVTNSGAGIPESKLPHIFDRYDRGAQKGSRGSGLGLYAVQCIVSAHEGHIDVVSEIGVETRFRVMLPLWRSPEQDAMDDNLPSQLTTD